MATEKYQLCSLAFSFQYRNNSIDGDQILCGTSTEYCTEDVSKPKEFPLFLASLFADQIRVTYIFQRSQFCSYQMHNNVN